ncbi:hypothetical protein HNQ35_000060 [Cerasibacillus quisquiliarum]|uniref:Protein gp8 n=1 Tax=Cerasibacillus quisquiliarum TaxID=227865 RepID=A0A511UUG3_9BACI|nr:hypothetical protein [Cerasibacillus quisquiliarum]MBB5144871.1 hypothetical protein [Cerasibacillus quisquiliarum]GEN30237.1 hypothetical protein CQU01_04750 [Cerasibacillus quisquiliarum]
MPYLTYNEYTELGFEEMEQSEFEKLLKRASGVLDSITRYFYRHNDLESDVEFRKEQFKKALAAQISYFYDMGGTSSHELNEPETVTIGRTTVSSGGRSNSNVEDNKNKLVSEDVYMYLSGTGLLYRGIGVV